MSKLKDLKQAIITEVMSYLNDSEGYTATYEGVGCNVEEWCEKKQPLYEILSRHPRWDEAQLAVVFSEDYERPANFSAVGSFWRWMYRVFCDSEGVKEIYAQHLGSVRYMNDILYNLLERLASCEAVAVPDDLQREFALSFPEFHISKGLKLTRALNKIAVALGVSVHPDYQKKYAIVADALSPMKATRFTSLSIHPVDFLRMSAGNSWTSCHRIDRDDVGCYSAGVLSYMNDAVTVIYSTYEADANGDRLRYADKLTRQCFYFNGGTLLQSRLYPQCNDGSTYLYDANRALVEGILSECYGLPNLWSTSSAICKDGRGALNYPDFKYLFEDLRKAYTLKALGVEPREVVVGAEAYDVATGNRLVHTEGIQQGYICADCGETLDADDAIYIDGEYYCRRCAHFCDYCEEWTREVVEYVEGFGYVCESCRESAFVACNNCGEVIHEDDAMMWDFEYYCEACYSDIMESAGDE